MDEIPPLPRPKQLGEITWYDREAQLALVGASLTALAGKQLSTSEVKDLDEALRAKRVQLLCDQLTPIKVKRWKVRRASQANLGSDSQD